MEDRPATLWRQGDVLIQELAPPEKDELAKYVKRRRPILAEGAATGHRHEIVPPLAARLYVRNEGSATDFDDGLLIEVVRQGARVTHPEHAPIPLPQGWYRAWRQREYGSLSVQD